MGEGGALSDFVHPRHAAQSRVEEGGSQSGKTSHQDISKNRLKLRFVLQLKFFQKVLMK